jgi:hypothetical protein
MIPRCGKFRSRARHITIASSLCASLFALLAAEPASAPIPATQPVVAIDAADQRQAHVAKVTRWWADLNHQDPVIREAARAGLMGLSRMDLPALREIVSESRPLSPTQTVLLREIVSQVFLSGEPYPTEGKYGFLGVRPSEVSMTSQDDVPALGDRGNDPNAIYGVVIVERMPGFCGARGFLDGDVILGIVERPSVPMHEPLEFTNAVKFMGAGETVHFQVLRQGQVIRVAITLDPRPSAAEDVVGKIQELLQLRQKTANEYWEKKFAPLLKEGVG